MTSPSPSRSPLDRRAALCRLAGHAAVWCGVWSGGLAAPHRLLTEWPRRPAPGHPTPRPGVTAARVLSAARLRELGTADAIPAFDEVRQIPQLVDGIRCHCGCADTPGHYSLLSCYEGDGMAQHCEICQGQGRMAFRLGRAGRSLDEIRAAVDQRYG